MQTESSLIDRLLREKESRPATATVGSVQDWFRTTFKRELPIGSFGLDPGHRKMGWEHSRAFDVSLSPSSNEGKQLISFLESQGIPYIASLGASKSSTGQVTSTGPHIHVGPPSHSMKNESLVERLLSEKGSRTEAQDVTAAPVVNALLQRRGDQRRYSTSESVAETVRRQTEAMNQYGVAVLKADKKRREFGRIRPNAGVGADVRTPFDFSVRLPSFELPPETLGRRAVRSSEATRQLANEPIERQVSRIAEERAQSSEALRSQIRAQMEEEWRRALTGGAIDTGYTSSSMYGASLAEREAEVERRAREIEDPQMRAAQLRSEYTAEDRAYIQKRVKALGGIGGYQRGETVGFEESGYNVADHLASIVRFLGLDPRAKESMDTIARAINRSTQRDRDALELAVQENPLTTGQSGVRLLASLPLPILETFAVTGALGNVKGMAALDVMGSVGRDESLAQNVAAGVRGGTTGLLFEATGGLPFVKRVGSVGAGTYAIETASGVVPVEAAKAAAINSIFVALGGRRKSGEVKLPEPVSSGDVSAAYPVEAIRAREATRPSTGVKLPDAVAAFRERSAARDAKASEETIRLYRGQGTQAPGAGSKNKADAGRWFTKSKELAEGYAEAARIGERPEPLRYVDVPVSEAETMLRRWSKDTPGNAEYVLNDKYMAQVRTELSLVDRLVAEKSIPGAASAPENVSQGATEAGKPPSQAILPSKETPLLVGARQTSNTQLYLTFERKPNLISDSSFKSLFPEYDVTVRRTRNALTPSTQAVELTFWEKGKPRQVKPPVDVLNRFGLAQEFARGKMPKLATGAAPAKDFEARNRDMFDYTPEERASQQKEVDVQEALRGNPQAPPIEESLGVKLPEPPEAAPKAPESAFVGQEGAASLEAVSLGVIGKVRKVAQTIRTMVRTRSVRDTMAYTRDAGDNSAMIFGQRMRSEVEGPMRQALGGKMPKEAPDALSFVVESQGDITQLNVMEGKITASTQAPPGWKKRALAAINYARTNYAALRPIAQRYEQITESQMLDENAAGIDTLKRNGYVMHAQDIEGPDIGYLAGGGKGEVSGFKKNRVFETFADSIAAGVNPKTLNALDLLSARVSRGTRLINRRGWVSGLRDLRDAKTRAPVVVDPDIITRADGTKYPQAPTGYSVEFNGFEPIAVRNGYEGIYSALTDPSWFSQNAATRGFMKANGFGKSISLMLDTFHLGRLALWESMIKATGLKTFKVPRPSYRRGLTLLDSTPAEIRRMEANGEIPASWTRNLLNRKAQIDLLVESGYNIGGVSDALHQEMIHAIPVVGQFNKWLFGQFQRGAMTEIGLLEFERRRAARPTETEAQTARAVAKDLNTRFGNFGRQGIFKSRTGQDLARALALAPQWNEGLIRSELGALTQAGRFIGDTAQGKRIYSGVLLRSVGGMAVAQFVANQLINMYTRGHPTWENPEEGWGAKVSAWIPDKLGGGPGFFLHPMGLAAETTHLLMKGYERSGDFSQALNDYLRGRASAAMRPALVFLSRRDYLGRALKPGTVWGEAVKSAIPTPIPGRAIASAVKEAVTGKPSETFPGEYQKQLMSSIGVRTESVPSGEQRVRKLAQEFNRDKGIEKSGEFYESTYAPLTGSLGKKGAEQQLQTLLQQKTRKEIVDHYQERTRVLLTGKKDREKEFKESLNPEQRQQYDKIRERRKRDLQEIRKLLGMPEEGGVTLPSPPTTKPISWNPTQNPDGTWSTPPIDRAMAREPKTGRRFKGDAGIQADPADFVQFRFRQLLLDPALDWVESLTPARDALRGKKWYDINPDLFVNENLKTRN